ncbi:MAG: glycoside hydrolase family 5 protein [Lachnospiraceae bacterium]|nr:glycoside hydrolase family 5 protein [Lachnospiraceae bacterium]
MNMREMKRRIAAAALSAMMVTCLSGGCGTVATPTQEEPKEQTETAKSEEKPAEKAEEKTAKAPAADAGTDENKGDQVGTKAEENASGGKTYSVSMLRIPDNEALTFTKNLGAGINLGNTFDAYLDGALAADRSNEMEAETYWQHVETTQDMIRDIADAGFHTIRIPVSWHDHIIDENVTISPAWMDRVNTVVDWALDAGMTVILNIHHDNHPAANGFYPDSAHAEQSKKYVGRIWEQLAERYKDYDDRLIFEAMNEPRLVDQECEWWFEVDDPTPEVKDAIGCINELNQLFVDTVRRVDGPHRTCYLMVPGYDASPDGALTPGFQLPRDAADIDNRIIVSIHAYTPYHFALEENGTNAFDSGKEDDTRDINAFITRLYQKYILMGTPVVIGEFGARDRGGNLEARADFAGYYTAKAWSAGIPCVWWDNNNFSGTGEEFGIYERVNRSWKFPEIRDAILENAKR